MPAPTFKIHRSFLFLFYFEFKRACVYMYKVQSTQQKYESKHLTKFRRNQTDTMSSNQEDPLLSKISVFIAQIQAQSTASSQQQVKEVLVDVSIIVYALSLLYASYKISSSPSSSSSSSSARLLNKNVGRARVPDEEEEKEVVPFRFLALPAELRMIVYEHLLVSPLLDGRIKCTNAHMAVGGLGLSPQILRVNSEIYAEAVGVLYERNIFQLRFIEDDGIDGDDDSDTAAKVWGLKDWQKKLFRGLGEKGEKGEDEDSADLNRAIIEAPDPDSEPPPTAVVVGGPMRLLQRLPRFLQNILRRVRFFRHRGMMNRRALCRFRPTKIHPHRLRRMRHLEILSSFSGTLYGNGILAEDVQISPSGENAFMNRIVIELLEYLIAAPPPSSEDMMGLIKTATATATAAENIRKTLLLIHSPDRYVIPSPILTLAHKRRLRQQIRKKFEILHALTHTRRILVRHEYCLVDSDDHVLDDFDEDDLPIFAGDKRLDWQALKNQEEMTARVCAGRVGIWEE